jgi:hypothetical protein
MMSETPAETYRREAEVCRLNAEEANNSVDKQAWLRLAADWTKLARSADLSKELQRMQIPPSSKRRHWCLVIRAQHFRDVSVDSRISKFIAVLY